MSKKPLVSICCISYNHERYIRECIEGFLIQKTVFPIEILIFDDASTDNTQKIIKKFAKKDNRIITFLQTENQWSLNKYGLVEWLFPAAKGKYIALCEGDDYWTDPLKLQKQFDVLENNKDISLCFTSRIVVDQAGNFLSDSNVAQRSWSTKEIALGFVPPTQTIFSRNYALQFIKFMNDHPYSYGGDKIYTYFHSLKGKIFSISDSTAAYRVHSGGEWSKYNLYQKNKLHVEQSLLFFKVISKNKLEEKELKDEFLEKIMLANLFLLFSEPVIGIKQIIYLVKGKKTRPKIIFTAINKYLSYYMSLLKNKIVK